jgi:hypothetical protein
MASKRETFLGRLWERFVSLGDDDRVNGIVKKAHDAVEGLTERVENAMPGSKDDSAEAKVEPAPVAEDKAAPLPPVRKTAAPATRSTTRSRAASPARSPARAGAKPAAVRKPRGAASEPTVEDAGAPRPGDDAKPTAARKSAGLKAVPKSESSRAASGTGAKTTKGDEAGAGEAKKPARTRKAPAKAKPATTKSADDSAASLAPVAPTANEDAVPGASPAVKDQADLPADAPANSDTAPVQLPSDAETSQAEGGASTVDNPAKQS